MTLALKLEKKVQGFSLVAAPLLLFASSFFWNDGEYSVSSATLLILSTFFWIPAFTGLFQLLKNKAPYYSVFGLWIAILDVFQAYALVSSDTLFQFLILRIKHICKHFLIILLHHSYCFLHQARFFH